MRCSTCCNEAETLFPLFGRGLLCRTCLEADGEYIAAHVDASYFDARIDLSSVIDEEEAKRCYRDLPPEKVLLETDR